MASATYDLICNADDGSI